MPIYDFKTSFSFIFIILNVPDLSNLMHQ